MSYERFVTPIRNSINQPFDTEFLRGRTEVTEVQNPSTELRWKVQGAGKRVKGRRGEWVKDTTHHQILPWAGRKVTQQKINSLRYTLIGKALMA
jgi:hypothetical protein